MIKSKLACTRKMARNYKPLIGVIRVKSDLTRRHITLILSPLTNFCTSTITEAFLYYGYIYAGDICAVGIIRWPVSFTTNFDCLLV